jgi:hypothetical protein
MHLVVVVLSLQHQVALLPHGGSNDFWADVFKPRET